MTDKTVRDAYIAAAQTRDLTQLELMLYTKLEVEQHRTATVHQAIRDALPYVDNSGARITLQNGILETGGTL
jgi:hypothetical protein